MWTWLMDKVVKDPLGLATRIHSIVWSRLLALSGLALAGLATMSFAPLLALAQAGGFSRDQLVAVFLVQFAQAVATEAWRRFKATDPELKG